MVGAVRVFGLFGGHEVDRAEDFAVAGGQVRVVLDGALVRIEPRQPQVGNLHHPVAAQEKIARLHVAMDRPLAVGVGQAAGALNDEIDRHLHRQRAAIFDELAQVRAVDVLHHQKMPPLILAGVVGQDDVRVRKLGGGQHLAMEAGDRVGRIDQLPLDDLDRPNHPHAAMQGLVNVSHAAAADAGQQCVLAKDQVVPLALIDGGGLVLGETTIGNELPGECFSVRRPLVRRQLGDVFFELIGRDESQAGDDAAIFGERLRRFCRQVELRRRGVFDRALVRS